MFASALIAMLSMTLLSKDTVVYEGKSGPGKRKHIVLLAGDEEYRSEEAMPQLAKILAYRQGFKCTVVFSVNPNGEIDPDARSNQPGIEALDTADLCVMMLRFREWPDSQMKHFVDYYLAGKPIVALRTSTHAFEYGEDSSSPYKNYGWRSKSWPGGFGRQVLGETWISHWGDHGRQATKGIVDPEQTKHPAMRGLFSIFGTTDVYEASPPKDATILIRGQVLEGMTVSSTPAVGRKKTAQGVEQDVNSPMMPIAWVRERKNGAGAVNKVFTTTMGAATDLMDQGVRRMLVNAVFWAVGLEKPTERRLDTKLVGSYAPTAFGFGGFKKGVRPADLAASEG